MSVENIDSLISSHPDVEAAREATAAARAASEAIASERAQKAVADEVEKIRAEFPEINDIEDIVRLPRYKEIKEKVEVGYSLSDAVKLVYEDTYIGRRTAAAVQRQKNATYSASHLSATRAHGVGGVEVTEAQIRSFMAGIPGASRADAIAAYQKYKPKRK